jgi:hypothetical protein
MLVVSPVETTAEHAEISSKRIHKSTAYPVPIHVAQEG